MNPFKKAPKAPDPTTTAQAQADINRINVFSPFGNTTYGNVDQNGNFKANTSGAAVSMGNPQQKQIYDNLTNGAAAQGGFSTGGPASWLGAQNIYNSLPSSGNADVRSGLPNIRSSGAIEGNLMQGGNISELYDGFAGDSNAVRDATYQAGLNKLQPQLDESSNKLAQILANRGISIDSDAYRTQQDRFDRAKGEQLNNLSLASVLAGSGEQSRLFDQANQRFQAGQGQRQQSLNEGLSLGGYESGVNNQMFGQNQQVFTNQNLLRQQALAEKMGLRGVQDSERDRQFNQQAGLLGIQQQAPNTGQVDLAGLTQGNYLAKLQNQQANNQTIGNLGASAAMIYAMSDKRLKDGIEKVGEKDGINIYEFSYKGTSERYRGVMAQEVSHIDGAVAIDDDGYLSVNYNVIGIPFERVN